MYNNIYNTQFSACYERNLNVVKGYFKGKPILILTILLALTAVIQAVLVIITTTQATPIVTSYVNKSNTSSYSYNFGGIGITFILTVVAFFIIYKKCNDTNLSASPKTGFSILFVVSIIDLVVLCIASAVILYALVFLYFAPELLKSQFSGSGSQNFSYSLTSTNATMDTVNKLVNAYHLFMLVLIIAVVVLLIILIIANAAKIKFYKSISSTLKNPVVPFVKGAKTFGVFNIVLAVAMFLFLLIILPTASTFVGTLQDSFGDSSTNSFNFSSLTTTTTISSIVIVALYAASSVFYAIVAFGYKKYIDVTTVGMTNSDFSRPQNVAANYYQGSYGQNNYYNSNQYYNPQQQASEMNQQTEQPQNTVYRQGCYPVGNVPFASQPQQNAQPVADQQNAQAVPNYNAQPVAPQQNAQVAPSYNQPVAPQQNAQVAPSYNQPVAPQQNAEFDLNSNPYEQPKQDFTDDRQ